MNKKTTISARLDEETVERFERQLDGDTTKSDTIREYVDHIIEEGHHERSPYDARINKLSREAREKRQKINLLETEREEIIREKERLERKRSTYEDSHERLQGRLEAVDSKLRKKGMNIHVKNDVIKDIAADYGHTPQEVVEMVQDRNPDVPSHAFTHPRDPNALANWTGFDDPDLAGRDVTERCDSDGGV